MSKLYLLLEDQIQDPSQQEQLPQNAPEPTDNQQQNPLQQYDLIIRRELFNKIKDIKNTLSNTREYNNKSIFEIVQFSQVILDYYDMFTTDVLMGILSNLTTQLEKISKK